MIYIVMLLVSAAFGVRAVGSEAAQDKGINKDSVVGADTIALSPSDPKRNDTFMLLEGDWHAAETADEKKQRLQAIDEVTKGLGRVRQSRARSRIAERTSPLPNLIIEFEKSQVAITSGDRRLELKLGSSPIEVSGGQGKAQVSAKIEGEQLIVFANGDKGERTTIYRADGSGLSMEVTMSADYLAGPLKYKTTYVREE
jgi:hypothetical protein